MGEPTASYRWTSWVWETTGWRSRLQETTHHSRRICGTYLNPIKIKKKTTERSQHVTSRFSLKTQSRILTDIYCPKLFPNTAGFAGGAPGSSVLEETSASYAACTTTTYLTWWTFSAGVDVYIQIVPVGTSYFITDDAVACIGGLKIAPLVSSITVPPEPARPNVNVATRSPQIFQVSLEAKLILEFFVKWFKRMRTRRVVPTSMFMRMHMAKSPEVFSMLKIPYITQRVLLDDLKTRFSSLFY